MRPGTFYELLSTAGGWLGDQGMLRESGRPVQLFHKPGVQASCGRLRHAPQ